MNNFLLVIGRDKMCIRDSFKMVQNMMHLAVTHHTAAEIIYQRADSEQPYMGLTT